MKEKKSPRILKHRKVREPLVECICPTCGTNHKVYMYWSGRGKPKVYCLKHKYLVQVEFTMESYTVHL